MNVPRYRAWRFRHPDIYTTFTHPAQHAGLNFSPQTGTDMVDGDASIRQAIYLLLSTKPGERVMRPTYGCSLHRLLFLPNDDTTAGLALYYVKTALETWEPRIEIVKLDANPNRQQPEQLDIVLQYRIRATGQVAALTFPLSLVGE